VGMRPGRVFARNLTSELSRRRIFLFGFAITR
jgi:hypothetical protein